MTEVVGVLERSEPCPRCGSSGRLVVLTDRDLTDRCYHCGFERHVTLPDDIEAAGTSRSKRPPNNVTLPGHSRRRRTAV